MAISSTLTRQLTDITLMQEAECKQRA